MNAMQYLDVTRVVLSLSGHETTKNTRVDRSVVHDGSTEVINLEFEVANFADRGLPAGHYSFPF